jgi:hypothetical protein
MVTAHCSLRALLAQELCLSSRSRRWALDGGAHNSIWEAWGRPAPADCCSTAAIQSVSLMVGQPSPCQAWPPLLRGGTHSDNMPHSM